MASEARSVYRILQRTITKQLSLEKGNQWQTYVRECFKRPTDNQSLASLQQALDLATDCADLLSSVKDHKVDIQDRTRPAGF